MSSLEFSTLKAESANFLPTQKLKIFVGTAYDRVKNEVPDNILITVSGTPALANGVLTADIEGEAGDLQTLVEGTRFNFGGGDFYLAEEVTLTADTPVVGVTFQAASGATVPASSDTATLNAYIPFYSANSANLSDNGETIEDNVFSNGFAMEKAMIGLNQSAEFAGPTVIGDPGLAILKECRTTGKVVDVEVIYPFCKGYEKFTSIVSDVPRNNERAAFQQTNVTMGITGEITEIVTP